MEVIFKNAPNVPRLGDPRRVANYAYPNWGLELGRWRKKSLGFYISEWGGGSKLQMLDVVNAITKTGFGNFTQMLRDINAKTVSHIVKGSESRVNYLEVGAGVSTVNMIERLYDDNVDLDKIFITMVEPSKSRLGDTTSELKGMGLREKKNFIYHVGRDIDSLKFVEPGSQKIIGSVAQIHHHAYLDTPLKVLYDALGNNGLILIADWHNSMWEHPARVYQALLMDYEWPSKEEDLKMFVSAYPKTLEIPPGLSDPDLMANTMIREFWKDYGKIKAELIKKGEFEKDDEIMILEGHRPIERQIEDMHKIGYKTDTVYVMRLVDDLGLNGNPYQMLKDSRIIMFTIGHKYIE